MVYQRFVEIGRVALVNYGPDAGNLVAILDILDQNRILVQGPSVHRQVLNMKRATLTDLKVVIGRQARTATLNAAWKAADTENKWNTSAWAKKLSAQKTRASLSDLDRFKLMVARKQKSKILAAEFNKLKKSNKK